MRLLKFFAVATFIVITVLGSVFLINRSVFLSVYDNRDAIQDGLELVETIFSLSGLADFIVSHPEYVSVVSYDINLPQKGIYFQADTMRTIGSLANLYILIEYARQVDAGLINSSEFIDLSDIDRFVLGTIKEASHQNAIRNIRREGAIERDQIALKDVVGLMIYHNSMPAADYLFYRLGSDNVQRLIQDLTDNQSEPFQPYISLHRHQILGYEDIDAYFDAISESERSEFVNENLHWFSQFISDREFEQDWQNKAMVSDFKLNFAKERRFHTIFPKAKPIAFAGIMESLARKTLINNEVSKIVRSFMDWPMADRTTRRNLREYGALYDNRISILSGVDFGRSAYSGQTYAQVVIFENLPVGLWLHMSSNFINQDYQKRLIFDPELHRYSRSVMEEPFENEPVN